MRTGRWRRMAAACALAAAALLCGGLAQALGVGDQAPAFALPATTTKQISSKDFTGKTLVLFFYTGAFTGP